MSVLALDGTKNSEKQVEPGGTPIGDSGTPASTTPRSVTQKSTGDATPETWLRDRLLATAVPTAVLLIGTVVYLRSISAPLPTVISSAEAELIGFTLVVLALLSVYSARSFGTDAALIVGTQRAEMGEMRKAFHEETTRLLERNAAHWHEQTELLAGAASALKRVVELQSGALDLTKAGIQLNQELLNLEHERERLRQAEVDVQRRRLQPQLGIRLEVPQVALLKHMNVWVHNRGMDGRNLVVFFGVEPTQVMESKAKGIDPQEVRRFDFGDIAAWPGDANLALTCEISDSLGNRYRFVCHFEYHRNHTGVISVPTVDPDDWTYPEGTML